MNESKWIFNPITIFGLSIVSLVTSLILFIYYYVEASTGLRALVSRFNLDQGQFLEVQPWFVIMILSLLVLIILTGIFLSFLYYLKTLQLYRLQNNFINNFTHELKTPVTSMQLYLETFLKHDLNRDDQKKFIQYMIEDVERLSANINSILNLGRIESKKYEGEFAKENLVEAVENCIRQNKRFFGACQINVEDLLDDPFYCRMNPSLFEILLMNLFTNALKYNSSNAPEIKIVIRKKDKKIQIRFTDNGIGIEKSQRRKIFKKFYQVGSSDNMSAKGSGLGLYIVSNIARIHKWKIKVRSKGLGKGTTFIIKIPVLKPKAAGEK